MKIVNTTLCLVFLLFFGSLTQAQKSGNSKVDSNIPLVVSESFNGMYSEKDPVWFSRYKGEGDQTLVYIAKFIFDKRYCQAIYGINGNQIAFAATVDYKELPEAARMYMKQNYPTFAIADAVLVTDSDKEVTYEIGIYIDAEYVIQVFSRDGTFIKNTKA
ncbi:hypothetical protein [Flavobacterium sp.]|uniref:hypothetical protein n=1 Tax=Flavobacterium sp. TaxID=239 RepID=UPI002633804C|nr:hypothetical protein [Flavobacterium sp.]MDG2432901.1 hypothetical protein [Flavobacterium sp.]